MKTVAENLKPPFVAAIMLDAVQADANDGPSPSDAMMSLAPKQSGFLGLETTCDDQGRWISISYWQDRESFTAWRKIGADHIASAFHGMDLERACKFRVSIVEAPIAQPRQLKADERAIPTSQIREARPGAGGFALGLKMFAAFPAIAELLGYEHVR